MPSPGLAMTDWDGFSLSPRLAVVESDRDAAPWEPWCYWDRWGYNWIQWDMLGPWIDDGEFDSVPHHSVIGPRTQCWLSLGEGISFGIDCELFLIFGPQGARLVYWFGGNSTMELHGSFFNEDWGYVHYVPLDDSTGGSHDVLD